MIRPLPAYRVLRKKVVGIHLLRRLLNAIGLCHANIHNACVVDKQFHCFNVVHYFGKARCYRCIIIRMPLPGEDGLH